MVLLVVDTQKGCFDERLYILVKSEDFEKAMSVLEEQGYRVV